MALPFLMMGAGARQPALAAGHPAYSGTFGTEAPGIGGYRTGGAHRAVSAGLAVAIAGGVGAALILALVAPDLTVRGPEILTGKNIVVPPPTIDDAPAPRPDERPTVMARPTSDVRPLTDDPVVIDRFDTDFGEIRVETGGGGLTGGGGAAERIIVAPAPVWREAVRDPRYANRFQPDYPSAMQREGTEGRCPVTVTIAASGRVTAVRDNGCANDAFLRATERQALRAWRFRPATRDGVAVESTQDVAVMFRIEE